MGGRATRIRLLDFTTLPMRAFHVTCSAICALAVRFSQEQQREEREMFNAALDRHAVEAGVGAVVADPAVS